MREIVFRLGRGEVMDIPQPADWTFGATIPAKNIQETRSFYEEVLRVELIAEDPGGIVYRSGDSYFTLYQTPYSGQAEHTLGGFVVRDFGAAVGELRGRGVVFEEYDMPDLGLKTEDGVAALPNGMQIAWFKDPEGNILSISTVPPIPS
jgi:catechol 2,3-dioxygenase-like lactoylglutathione lyase family enzyme